MCEYKTKHVNGLAKHKEVKHEGIRFNCDQCDSVFSSKYNMEVHKKTLHGECSFVCDPCDYKGSTENHFKRHKKSGRHVLRVDI